ncbi:major facilitator superfamily domain-containing protein 6-like [Clytia hemisphaerica]|uniref:Major facilitator superfamily (MFS) profile domain-containing protein n=1 Tax=Clytia hemisphaerica TaxID=252671 RepID=A0A7M5UVG8_9CNID
MCLNRVGSEDKAQQNKENDTATRQEQQQAQEAHNMDDTTSIKDEIQQECVCCSGGINYSLLPSKLFYFFFFAGNGSLIPYLVLFFKQLGLNPSQVGIVSGLKPFISFLFSPLWGYIADKSRRTKFIFVISLLAYIGGYFAYSLAPVKNLCKARNSTTHGSTHHPFMFHMHKRSVLSQNYNHYKLHLEQKSSSSKSNINRKSSIKYNATTFPIKSQIPYLFADITPTLMSDPLFHMPSGVAFFGTNDEFLPEVSFSETGQSRGDDMEDDDTKDIYSEKTWHGTVRHAFAPWTICGAAKANSIDTLSLDQSGNKERKSDNSKIFLYLLTVTIVATLFSCPLITIVDTATIRKLRETAETHKYGNQRMWGSFGWGITAFAVGALISTLPLCPGINKEVNYYPSFYIFSGFLIFSLFSGWNLQFEENKEESGEEQQTSRTQRIIDGLKLMKDPTYCSFIATSFFIGITMSVIKTFLFWYLKDIGAPQILFSIIAAVNCISEVTVYFFSSELIKRLTHFGVLYVALICYSLRLFYYGLLTSPWYVLAAEPLSGVTTAAAWAAMTSYVGINAAPESVTTMQGILHGIHWGLGHGIGELIGGFMVSSLGAAATFNIFGVLTLLHLLIFWLINNYASRKKRLAEDEVEDVANKTNIVE